jgi:uncharacterized paraquat-inducible protein A
LKWPTRHFQDQQDEKIVDPELNGRKAVMHSRVGTCPLCNGAVPLQIVSLGRPFDCPSCGKALKVHGIHALVIRLVAVAIGFLLARAAGFESFLLFCFGLMISPFLVIPVWRISTGIIRPVLIPASPVVTTLNLDGGH